MAFLIMRLYMNKKFFTAGREICLLFFVKKAGKCGKIY